VRISPLNNIDKIIQTAFPLWPGQNDPAGSLFAKENKWFDALRGPWTERFGI